MSLLSLSDVLKCHSPSSSCVYKLPEYYFFRQLGLAAPVMCTSCVWIMGHIVETPVIKFTRG